MNTAEAMAFINPQVRDLKAYHLEPDSCTVKLNQNENPFDWPREIKEEVARFCVERPWNRYPPFVPEELKDALAAHTGAEKGGVIVGNGSNEMLLVLLLSLCGRGTRVIICEPTFTVYKLLVNGLAAMPVTVPLTPGLSYDVEAIVTAAAANPGSLLILCSPNNPTGCTLGEADLRRILEVHRGFCILDQAYVEFGAYNGIPLIREFPNLIVTRTFSKAFAGAGLRLGYLVGNPSVVAEFNKIKLPYNINFFIEHTALTLVKHHEVIAKTHATIIAERDALAAYFKTLPFEAVYPSAANFIVVRYAHKQRLFDALKLQGILVRDVSSYPMLENCLRISVGSREENALLRQALDSFFNRQS